jgi:preprotein translocase subunit SecY
MALKNKKVITMILFTALILLIWRLAYTIQIPLIDRQILGSDLQLFGFLDVFSGGALSNYSIVALGVSPYITASIVIQLLQMDIVPTLKEWAEEGEVGKKKLSQVTRYLALGLAFVQSLTITVGLAAYYDSSMMFQTGVDVNAFTYVYLALVLTAGTAFVLWLAEKISLKGIGNGTSMFIVAGIVSSFPTMIDALLKQFIMKDDAKFVDIVLFFVVLLLFVVIIVGVVFMEAAQRKIPVQYANRPASAAFRGKGDSNIPIKLNSASVIPVIFASTLMSLPATIVNFLDQSSNTTYWLNQIFDYSQPIGFVIYIILIFVFSFFYSFLQMNPEKMAENLQKQNAYIPGIRPGAETASYISRVLFKITMVGAIYLSLIASIPIFMQRIFNLDSRIQIGGTSLIIVVGVAIETAKQLKTQSQDKQYRGFIE